MIPVWILTFNRPVALNRLVTELGRQGFRSNIFSNHPLVQVTEESQKYIDDVIINTSNTEESNSWCARAWNTIYMKGFAKSEELLCFQDDTYISPYFGQWINEQSKNYDFIWGPAGDQFHFIRFDILKKVGWWDERYIGCYCGDAEYVKRVYNRTDHSRMSFEDTHPWGGMLNPCGIINNIVTTYESKTVDPDYDNQHWQFEKACGGHNTSSVNPTVKAADAHYLNKWGIALNDNRPVFGSHNVPNFGEINWYPWFSQKHGFTAYQ